MALISELKVEEIGELLVLGKEVFDEGSYRDAGYDVHKTQSYLKACVLNQWMVCLVAREGEGTPIIGFIIAVIEQDWFGCDSCAYEKLLFVKKESRRSRMGGQLIEALLYWAKEQGAPAVRAGTTLQVKTEAVKNLYESLGFETTGYLFLQRL
jgi:GNAT superfamily N-acetyltransferase